ncbi:hypothetical protein CEXT_444061 [Caerostris extrusa]|uniref:Uncharacterized protein n=1 Tax=Caerostris extrusa TaxID=172846 RepID=A0AAV4VTG0_CAEEX|nr:hypothetical protein CEXT_444061 [Caerostris extrusa]
MGIPVSPHPPQNCSHHFSPPKMSDNNTILNNGCEKVSVTDSTHENPIKTPSQAEAAQKAGQAAHRHGLRLLRVAGSHRALPLLRVPVGSPHSPKDGSKMPVPQALMSDPLAKSEFGLNVSDWIATTPRDDSVTSSQKGAGQLVMNLVHWLACLHL